MAATKKKRSKKKRQASGYVGVDGQIGTVQGHLSELHARLVSVEQQIGDLRTHMHAHAARLDDFQEQQGTRNSQILDRLIALERNQQRALENARHAVVSEVETSRPPLVSRMRVRWALAEVLAATEIVGQQPGELRRLLLKTIEEL